MKEKIDLFARGVFAYDRPEPVVSVGNIGISVEMGKVFRGSFSVRASDGSSFKGLVYSTDSLLSFASDTFSGSDNLIEYSFDAGHLDINDTIKGRITIVSSLGECDIPFQAKVKVPTCDTSVGPASDLFHFASLAQTEWSEAKNLFKTDEFRRTLSFYDSKYDNLYRSLMQSGNTSLALEEFLAASRKKRPVTIKTSVSEVSYENPGEKFADSITLTKDTWGYAQLTVETEGRFIDVERRIIWSEDFAGSSYVLSYTIDPRYLHEGTNLGAIRIVSVHDTITVPVIIKNSSKNLKSRLARRKQRHIEMKLLTNYIDFRMGSIGPAKFVSEEQNCLTSLKVFKPESLRERLINISLLIEGGRDGQAHTALGVIFEDEEWGDNLLYYAASLWLKARIAHDSEAAELARRLRDLYENSGDARIYLMCINLDRKGRLNPQNRFDALRRSREGSTSPIVLMEACRILNEDPTVLKEFSGFDMRVVNYGLRNKCINKNAVLQFAYLALRQKTTSQFAINVLLHAAEMYRLNETVEALCTHLIYGEKHDETAFKWLCIGISEQINVKNLYENCLLSAGKVPSTPLPKGMLSYFENGIDLDDDTVAVYYANIVRFRSTADAIPFAMMQRIREFTLRKLSEGQIDINLAVLYNNVISDRDLDAQMKSVLPDIIFKNSVDPHWDNAVEVMITHKELERETAFAMSGRTALVDIFTENPEITAADEHGNRIVPVSVDINRLITNASLIRACLSFCDDDIRVILNALEGARYRGDSEEAIELIKKCMGREELEKHFAIECRRELVEYYYDNLEGELMEDLLVRMDLSILSCRDRARMLDLMILRELYSLAMKNMELYGCTGVDIKRLARLASKLIETGSDMTGSRMFTDICIAIFRKKKHDNTILGYLIKYYNGDTETMYQLWSTANEEGIASDELEERLLAQILFTENDMSYSGDVFRHYYGHGSNRRLIRAYLSYHSYKYLICDQIPSSDLLEIMRRETNYEDNDLCVLALLKYFSQKKSYSDADKVFIEHRISLLERKGIILPFFRNFGSDIKVPESMRDKYYVEYHTDPKKRVKLFYCLMNGNQEANYVESNMKDVGYGIFVSEFVLFYGEVLQYYISEEDGDNYTITESSEVYLEPELISGDETGYHQLNLIITAREMNDAKTMQKLLESYVRSDYLSKRLFNPIV